MSKKKSYMTRYTISLFKEILEKERTLDVPYLIYCVSQKLEELYGGDYLESRLTRIGLNTTTDIRDALNEFILSRQAYLKKLGLIGDKEDETENG